MMMTMDTQSNKDFDITVTLTEKEASQALAQFIALKLGNGFSIKPDSVKFVVGLKYEDRPGGSSSPHFQKVTAQAIKVG